MFNFITESYAKFLKRIGKFTEIDPRKVVILSSIFIVIFIFSAYSLDMTKHHKALKVNTHLLLTNRGVKFYMSNIRKGPVKNAAITYKYKGDEYENIYDVLMFAMQGMNYYVQTPDQEVDGTFSMSSNTDEEIIFIIYPGIMSSFNKADQEKIKQAFEEMTFSIRYTDMFGDEVIFNSGFKAGADESSTVRKIANSKQ